MCETEIKKPKFPQLAGKIAETGATTKQLANALGISQSSWSKRMSGEVEFDLSEIIALTEFFDCEFNDIFSKIN